ncbi:MAG: polyhydroxyalkanoate synthesis regulator DNA-binding domain-containing protein [Deltaproteobacteria bacterium]|nr:polyhydroxyalkanoate synthesis regulator DNA-binding domain-containing protein [Deltaproteobacteria bacterium]
MSKGKSPGRNKRVHSGEKVPEWQVTELRRYSNRRIYDTRRSRYVTLDEVRDIITDGEKIRVLDLGSGRDVTRFVLMKLLSSIEEEQGMHALFVHLQQCPFCSQDVSSTAIGKYLGHSRRA